MTTKYGQTTKLGRHRNEPSDQLIKLIDAMFKVLIIVFFSFVFFIVYTYVLILVEVIYLIGL